MEQYDSLSLDRDHISLLTQVLTTSLHGQTKESAQRFRARSAEHLDELDSLQQFGYIRIERGYYLLRPAALIALAGTDSQAKSLVCLCEDLFKCLSTWYQSHAGEEIELDELAALAGVPECQVRTAAQYLSEAVVFDGTSGTTDQPIQSMQPSERILRHSSFVDMVAAQQHEADRCRASQWRTASVESAPGRALDASDYVDLERLIALRQLEATSFDLRKLTRLCEELNDCWARGNLFAIGGLLRTLLDHVPPILGHQTFKEVANNFARRSVKESFVRLEKSSRDISNSLLHDTIRQSVDMPTRTRVNFSHDLDVLLGEICRLLNTKS